MIIFTHKALLRLQHSRKFSCDERHGHYNFAILCLYILSFDKKWWKGVTPSWVTTLVRDPLGDATTKLGKIKCSSLLLVLLGTIILFSFSIVLFHKWLIFVLHTKSILGLSFFNNGNVRPNKFKLFWKTTQNRPFMHLTHLHSAWRKWQLSSYSGDNGKIW